MWLTHAIRTYMVMVMCLPLSLTMAQTPLPPGGQVVLNSEASGFQFGLWGANYRQAKMTQHTVNDPRFTKVWKVEVNSDVQDGFSIQLSADVPHALSKNDTLLLVAWVRTVATRSETNQGTAGLALEQAGAPYTKEIERTTQTDDQWMEYLLPGRLSAAYDANKLRMKVFLAHGRQTIEVAGIRVLNYGPNVDPADLPRTNLTYPGREPNAPWRALAQQRIEILRKGNLRVQVQDDQGNPVPQAQVQVEMTRHAFPFGCVYNNSRITGIYAGTQHSQTYRTKYLQYFNYGVDEGGMKWTVWDNVSTRQTTIDSANWMVQNGIPVRGHTMIWPSWERTPSWLREYENDPVMLGKKINVHNKEMAATFAGKVTEWDVVNEPYLNNAILNILGRSVMVEWFQKARQDDPNAVLYINEAGVPNSPPAHERYTVLENDIQMLQAAGAPIGGIGMQGHFGSALNSPDTLIQIYDRFALLNLPIRITELDINVDDEQLQADYLRDFLTVTFSHPAINGIVLWGFWEGQFWKPQAALWRFDWTIKPSGQAYLDLVFGEWWTRASGVSGTDGSFTSRGFLGDYLVRVTHNNRVTQVAGTLASPGSTITVQLGDY